jgi:hypothetical protein
MTPAAPAPSCPFYGASLHFRTAGHFGTTGRAALIPSSGNRCALITSAHSPCWMEVAESRRPWWEDCPRNPEFVTFVVRGIEAADRFNEHVGYMDNLRVQRGIAAAGFPPKAGA